MTVLRVEELDVNRIPWDEDPCFDFRPVDGWKIPAANGWSMLPAATWSVQSVSTTTFSQFLRRKMTHVFSGSHPTRTYINWTSMMFGGCIMPTAIGSNLRELSGGFVEGTRNAGASR